MALPRRATLALGYNLNHLGHRLIYAIARFHTDLVVTLLQRNAFRRLVLIATPYAPRGDKQRLEDRPTIKKILRAKPTSVAVELTDYPSLAVDPGRPPAVLHEGGWPDLVRPFRLRRLHAKGRFPVTVSHHGLPPSATLRTFGMDLLLCDSEPHDALICTSRAARSVIESTMEHFQEALSRRCGQSPRFHGRVETIPLGVDPRAYRPRPKRPLRARFGLPADAIVLLWFGRFDFVGKTNLLPLLRVLRFVIDDNPGVNLCLAIAGEPGRSHEEELFRSYAAALGVTQHVRRVTGLTPADDAFLYATADIFLCPSDNVCENFGLAPIQAMASGVPQVVSDWDGHRDTVVHGETGFLVPTRFGLCDPRLSLQASFLERGESLSLLVETTAVDVRALREHVGALLRSVELRRAMGKRSRERAVALFSLDQIASRYEALWGELSAMARANGACSAPFVDARRVPLFEVYRAQATEVLGDDARLSLSEAGARVLEGEEAVPIARLQPSAIEPEIAFRILASIARRARVAGEIVRAASRSSRRAPDAIWCDLMWLLKHGYIELERGPSPH